jgi:hypothetical protein
MFSGEQNTAPLEEVKFVIFCAYPDFYEGANATGLGCINDHPDPYFDDTYVLWNFTVNGGFFSGGANVDWVATIPYGIWHYASDWLTVSAAKFGGLLLFVPTLILTLTFPIDFEDELQPIENIATGIYSTIWLIFFYGLYKTISPFVGR